MIDDFQRVKEALPIKDTILSLTGLRMAGPHLEHCPFCGGHECFSIKEKIFKCFQCDAKGDVFNFLEKFEGLTQKEALEKAAALAGIELTLPKAKPADQPPSVRDKIFSAAADYYHANAMGGEGRAYFVETRKRTERIIASEKVGWSVGWLHEHLLGLGFSIIDCVESGLVKSDGEKNKDAFYPGCALFPQFSQGRVLHISKKDPKSKTCPDSEKAWRKAQLRKEYRDKDWIAYGQDALYRKGEIVIVEGEHDRLSLLEAGLDSVIATVGNPSAENFKRIVSHCAGRHVYLCFDSDAGGKGYTRMFARALMAEGAVVRIMTFDGAKDIDEYLREFSGDRRKEVKKLQVEAVDLLTWEIRQASLLDGLQARHEYLKAQGVYKAVAEMSELNQELYLDKIVRLGFTPKAVHEVLEIEDSLLDVLEAHYEAAGGKKNSDARKLAEKIFSWLKNKGKFFKTDDGKVYLFYHKQIYEIGDNLNFNTLMGKLTHLAPIEAPGKGVWHWLRCFCNDRGDRVSVMTWLHTDRKTGTVYMNLNSPRNMLIKLAPGRDPEEIPNGTNAEGVLLSSGTKIHPFAYQPDIQTAEGFRALKRLFFDNLACEREQKYFILCFLISFVFADFNKTKGELRNRGATKSGKTSAASLISYIVFGDDYVGKSSTASAISNSARDPIVFKDNLETRHLNQATIDFLLYGANSAIVEKRKSGSDTENTEERMKSLIVTTGIEPFPGYLEELVNRTFEVVFDKKRYATPGFVEFQVLAGLERDRDMMLSAIFRLVTKEIMPKLEQRSVWLRRLKEDYNGHNKERSDEWLSLILVILDAVVKYIPYYDENHPLFGVGHDSRDILRKWIEYQNDLASEIGITSNNILVMLNGIVHETENEMKNKQLGEPQEHPAWPDQRCHVYAHSELHLEMLWTLPEYIEVEEEDGRKATMRRKFIQFEIGSGDLHTVFNKFCRMTGTKNPYDNGIALGCRLKNDLAVIEKGGWTIFGKSGHLHYRKIHNVKIYRFRKELRFD